MMLAARSKSCLCRVRASPSQPPFKSSRLQLLLSLLDSRTAPEIPAMDTRSFSDVSRDVGRPRLSDIYGYKESELTKKTGTEKTSTKPNILVIFGDDIGIPQVS